MLWPSWGSRVPEEIDLASVVDHKFYGRPFGKKRPSISGKGMLMRADLKQCWQNLNNSPKDFDTPEK